MSGTPAPRKMTFATSCIVSAVASCSGEAVSFPFDLAKVRLQLQTASANMSMSATPLTGLSHGTIEKVTPGSGVGAKRYYAGMNDLLRCVARREGWRGLYRGLRPALLRQATYGTIKVVVYEESKHILSGVSGLSTTVSIVLAGVSAGALSSAICTPTDLIKVRMQAGDQHLYKGIISAGASIVKKEGVVALYNGWVPTTQRAILITLLNLSCYDATKDGLLSLSSVFQDNTPTHLLASLLTGVLSTYGSQPIDVIKSRIMNQPCDPKTGRYKLYGSSTECAVKTFKNEGPLALWKGSIPNFCRTVPWLLVFWPSFEYLKSLAFRLEDESTRR